MTCTRNYSDKCIFWSINLWTFYLSSERPICLTSKCTHISPPWLRPLPSEAVARGSAAAAFSYDFQRWRLPHRSHRRIWRHAEARTVQRPFIIVQAGFSHQTTPQINPALEQERKNPKTQSTRKVWDLLPDNIPILPSFFPFHHRFLYNLTRRHNSCTSDKHRLAPKHTHTWLERAVLVNFLSFLSTLVNIYMQTSIYLRVVLHPIWDHYRRALEALIRDWLMRSSESHFIGTL